MSIRTHLSFPTADLDAAIGFYTTLFGEGPHKQRPDFARFAPADVPISLSLNAAPGVVVDSPNHYGLRVPDGAALSQAQARLGVAGLIQSTEAGETCCWATQDKVWAHDPDGREWEVYVLLDDAPDVERSADSSCCAPTVAAPAPTPAPACCG